jgi:hypothetical protein
MKKSVSALFISLLFVAGWSQAQNAAQSAGTGGIRESTDPQRAAEVERKAEEISGQSGTPSGASGPSEHVYSGEEHPKVKSKKKSMHKKGSPSGSSGAAESTAPTVPQSTPKQAPSAAPYETTPGSSGASGSSGISGASGSPGSSGAGVSGDSGSGMEQGGVGRSEKMPPSNDTIQLPRLPSQ